MAFLNIPGVSIRGIAASVPRGINENINYPGFLKDEAENIISAIGINRRRISDSNTCTSDLCYHAAEKLLNELNWDRSEIDCLIMVTQTPDYTLPATACLLQKRMGLKEETYTMDINLGCSGWIYGLSAISSLMSHGSMKKGLLMAGDTTLKFCSAEDKSTFPLFGDAGSVTALEYDPDSSGFRFHTATDGSGYNAIFIPDGGFRNQVTASSFEMTEIKPGIRRNRLQVILDGMNVLSFSIIKAPESIKLLAEKFDLGLSDVDYFVFHQANRFMNERIRVKLGIPSEKVPYSLKEFGNTGPATIPLTMVTELAEVLSQNRKLNIVACGFGVGLSWGTVQFFSERIICPNIVEV